MDPKLVAFAMFVAFLIHCEPFNQPILFLDVMPNDIASGTLQPTIGPLFEISFNLQSFCSFIHVIDEIGKLCVFPGKFFEIGCDAFFKYFSAEEMEGLMEPCCAFSV